MLKNNAEPTRQKSHAGTAKKVVQPAGTGNQPSGNARSTSEERWGDDVDCQEWPSRED